MRSFISILLVAAFFSISIQSSHAKLALLPTIDVLAQLSMEQDRQKVVTFMAKPEVQKEMIKNGVNPLEALNRVSGLSHSEVRNLAQQIDHAQAGGDFGVGSIIGAAVLIFLVLLVTDILGYTSVFPFTNSIKN